MVVSSNLDDDLYAMKVQMFCFKKKKKLKWQLGDLTSDSSQFTLQAQTKAIKYFLRFACEAESKIKEFTGSTKPLLFKNRIRFLIEDRSLLRLIVPGVFKSHFSV